jgi:signal transduction histidine kinase
MHPFRWLRAHPLMADGALAAFLAAAGIAGLWVGPAAKHERPAGVLAVLLVLAVTVPLLWRRRRPVPVLAVSSVALMLLTALRYRDNPGNLGVLVAAYSVGAHARSRRQVVQAAAVCMPAFLAFLVIGVIIHYEGATFWNVFGNAVVFSTAFILGDNMRRRRQRVADLEHLAERLKREQTLLAERAVSEERARLARELHDVVAHSMSMMVVQAGGARRISSTQPERAAAALAQIEETGRQALVEMRRLLGVLRADDRAALNGDRFVAPPQPSLRALEQLTAMPGLPVVLTVEGAPPELPSAIDLSGYRIVQEALTNVRKHAGTAQAEVRVRYGADAVEIEVADDGRGAATPRGSGLGLVGMRERVTMCGGDLRVGPRPGGGWLVHARLPYASA